MGATSVFPFSVVFMSLYFIHSEDVMAYLGDLSDVSGEMEFDLKDDGMSV